MTPPTQNIPCICGNPQCPLIDYCHCGCGQMVMAAKGHGKKGKTQYLLGHHRRIRPTLEEAAPFKIDGEYCRIIPLQSATYSGIYAIVDQCDYARIMHYRWHAELNKGNGTFYAVRRGRHGWVFMHREILAMDATDERTGDHVETLATLDNRRKNLRIATPAQNSQNRRRARNNTTGYKGVTRDKGSAKYTATIYPNGQEIYLGRRDTAEEAHALYCAAAVKYYGEFARFA